MYMYTPQVKRKSSGRIIQRSIKLLAILPISIVIEVPTCPLLSLLLLSLTLVASGDIPRAEDTYHRVISGQTETLGLDHPDTLLSMNNLANLLSDIGKLEEAEEMYVRSLAGQRRTIGDDHEETIGAFSSSPL
jgi:hypothetical protein